jgi:hypothetical protein
MIHLSRGKSSAYEVPEFSDMVARARELQAENMADEVIDISDDGSNDWMDKETAAGRIIRLLDHKHVQPKARNFGRGGVGRSASAHEPAFRSTGSTPVVIAWSRERRLSAHLHHWP